MDIKKADSKGRVSGFTPGELYALNREEGTFSVLTLSAPDGRPINQALTEEMAAFHHWYARVAYKVVE